MALFTDVVHGLSNWKAFLIGVVVDPQSLMAFLKKSGVE